MIVGNKQKAVIGIAVLLLALFAAASAVLIPWASRNVNVSLPDGVKAINIKDPSSYVQPDGTGMLKRDDYATTDDYLIAASKAMGDEIEVPDDFVQLGDYGYTKGIAHITFSRSIGEEAAREIVSKHGGLWVNGQFSVDTGEDTAEVEAYFPDLASGDIAALETRCAEIEKESGVVGTRWKTSISRPSDQEKSSVQPYLGACSFL